ncbi:hypothetical protein [Williamsia sp. R60]
MRAGIRHGCIQTASTPEALAARLPDQLRYLEGLDTPGDYQALMGNVVGWLNHAAPGYGQKLAAPVLRAAGLSAADFYRVALTGAL